MTSRSQRIVLWVLVACIAAMSIVLFARRQRDRDRIASLADDTPIDAPYTTAETVTFDLANDSDGTVTANDRRMALPSEVNARARALIDHLVAQYALPGSPHPLPPGIAVNEVFLVPLPLVGHAVNTSSTASDTGSAPTIPVASTDPDAPQPKTPGGELAIIDLRGSFVNSHPSGVETESLTLLSIIGTLHANLPQIEQVRFLVDGEPRETLAGHADLLRTYPSRDTTVTPSIGSGGQP
jgi:Sporulation and spore germination